MGISRKMLARLTCVALLLVALATAYDASQDDVVTLLQDEKAYDPSIQREHLADVNKIQDFPSMQSYISKRMKDVVKQELAKNFNGEAETIAIGNAVKEMEAKHAVEAELNSEVKVDCEVGACTKLCDGGKMKRTRPVTRKPMNGGRTCPVLENTVNCNTESCASEKYARRAARRKLTREEKRAEMAQNDILSRQAMRATDVKTMMRSVRKVMRKMVHTHMAEVHLPGAKGPRSAESLVRRDLKTAMAKNAVNKAMRGFQATQTGTQIVREEKKEGILPKAVKPTAN